MSVPALVRRRSKAIAVIALSALAATAAGVVAGQASQAATPADAPSATKTVTASPTGVYLVQLDEAPVVEYAGGVAGLRPTRVAPGRRLDRTDNGVRAYVAHLGAQRDRVLSKVGGVKKLYDYDYTLAGFAAKMSYTDAVKLAATPGVSSVEAARTVTADTVDTPRFLGLAGDDGAWEKVGGIDKAGDGIIIGDIDSGIVPERASFAPIETTRASDAIVAAKWHGVCQSGAEEPVACNNKLIGARYFKAGATVAPEEFDSPRDLNGHGTHTAGTAAGDNDVPMTVLGHYYGQGSGIAPHARLAVYKALWHQPSTGTASGSTADLVAAVDAAVADGVDVINYSISGSSSPTDPVSVAFLRAARAGVFVATSAGNDGPGVSTVSKNYPWVTTVANGTHDREIRTTITLGNGQSYTGAGIGNGSPTAPIALAVDVAKDGANTADAARCFPDTLDPAKATGKIVVCDRGVTARVDKSLQVKNAGGIGMVLVNVTPSTLDSDLHSVPTVHLDHVSGPAVKEYAAVAGGTATILPAETVRVNASKVASSSSRGPGLPIGGDLLKPDVMAPGTNVLAATSALSAAGGEYAFLSGTSMASPHIAGMAAVLMGYHPDWSPMEVKSAIMTSATTKDTDGNPISNDTGSPGSPFGYGAGLMQARPSLEPGLVYDSSYAEWLQFVCGSGLVGSTSAFCANGKIDPSDLNYPTIAIGDLAGRQTVRRNVTNVTKKAETYVASVEGLAGLGVTVTPRVITVQPGSVASFTVTFEQQTAPLDQYSFGKLTWMSPKHTVSSVLAIRPQAIKAPVRVVGTGTDGSAAITLTTGYNGTLDTTVGGLVLPTISQATLKNPTGASFPTTAPKVNDHVAKFTIVVPAGTKHLRLATYDADYPAGTDIDLHVYPAGSSTRIAASTGDTAQERVDIASPSGSYDVYVDLFAGAAEQVVSLNHWLVGDTAAGNLTATPASQPATVAGEVTVTATWSGLEAGKHYLGRLAYSDGTAVRGSTLVEVNS